MLRGVCGRHYRLRRYVEAISIKRSTTLETASTGPNGLACPSSATDVRSPTSSHEAAACNEARWGHTHQCGDSFSLGASLCRTDDVAFADYLYRRRGCAGPPRMRCRRPLWDDRAPRWGQRQNL